MWNCKICSAEVEDDSWETCWRCSSPRTLEEARAAELKKRHEAQLAIYRSCLRCEGQMEYAGTKTFREGGGFGALGGLGELFVGRECYDVYFCPSCGKVEFYVDGIGDVMRGEVQA